jgi:hypothetical protein
MGGKGDTLPGLATFSHYIDSAKKLAKKEKDSCGGNVLPEHLFFICPLRR